MNFVTENVLGLLNLPIVDFWLTIARFRIRCVNQMQACSLTAVVCAARPYWNAEKASDESNEQGD